MVPAELLWEWTFMKKIATVVGARPQFVKCAVLRKLFNDTDEVEEILIHTGQHYDYEMSAGFFDELNIRAPNIQLEPKHRSHGGMTGDMLRQLEDVFIAEKPDAVLVYGDTNSTLAGALAAAKIHIPVVHIEAGLRSFNKKMPEEINRILSDHVSDLLFCPTFTAVNNLTNENITNGVHHVGDIMYDACLLAAKNLRIDIRSKYGLSDREFGLLTLHRAENTHDPSKFRELLSYVENHSQSRQLIWPIHPGTLSKMQEYNIALPGKIKVSGPLSYLELQSVLSQASLVLTDSGGLQKEAYFHRTPCITLREETEWVETIDCGWNRLWRVPSYQKRCEVEDFGTGNTGLQIFEIVKNFLDFRTGKRG